MKRLIILVLVSIVLLMGMSYAQDSTSVTFTTVYNDLKVAVQEIGKALGVASEYVYDVLIKQQLVVGITNVVIYLFSFIISWVFISIAKKMTNNEENYEDEAIVFTLTGALTSTLCSILFFIFSITTTITAFINPEYGALKEIFEVIK